MITEIGAVKVRGGEVLGEFQTLVNPHTSIPPFIAVLTGITNSMVASSPPIESALPAFLEFAQGCVLVAHNAPFDVGFLKHFAAAAGSTLARLRGARHRPARPARGHPRRRAQLQAQLARRSRSAPRTTPNHRALVRRPGHGRRAARPDGAARRPRRAHARGAADVQLARQSRRTPQAAPRRAPAALPRRLPVPRRAASGCSTSAPAATCAPACAPTSPPPRPARGWARWSTSPPRSPASSAPPRSRRGCASCA